MDENRVLSPDTPTMWIMARLRERQDLLNLLGDGDFPTPGAAFAVPPIYQAGEVPVNHPARFIVVQPPTKHDQRYYAEQSPQSQTSHYRVWGETSSDRLPDGYDLDGVLSLIGDEIARALKGVRTATTANGGAVFSSTICGAYTPRPVKPTEYVTIKQRGVELDLLSV